MRTLLQTSRVAVLCTCAAITATLPGCAGTATSAPAVGGSTLKVYVGQSARGAGGAQTQDVLDAERLALRQAGDQVGHFKVVLRPLTAARISDQARTAISDSATIAYLGELTPHSSADSLGITNGAGILQITPNDTAIELTQITNTIKNSPTRYYESLKTYGRTFGRVVPAANHEAKVQAQTISARGVKRLYVADDGGSYGSAIALALTGAAGGKGLAVTRGAADPAKVRSSGADAAFMGAGDPAAATRFFDAVAGASPSVKLFGPSALDDDAFAAGLAPAAQRSLEISAPGFMVGGPKADVPPAGRRFISDFKAAYGHDPARAAIFGYEAMAVLLDALKRAGSQANSRSAVVTEFQKTKQRSSVLGTYSIDGNGDTTLAPYVISHFKAGRLVPFESVQG